MIPAEYYQSIYLHIVLLMVLWSWLWLYNSDANRIINEKRGALSGYFLALFFIFFIGLRPVHAVFIDMPGYAAGYAARQMGYSNSIGDRGDWLWDLLMQGCSQIMDARYFFLIVEALYVIPIVIACKRWFSDNLTLAILFCFSTFSFFAYGINTIRAGVAMSFLMLALSFIGGNRKENILSAIFIFIAIAVHRSSGLPIAMILISLFYKNTRVIMFLWFMSFIVSLAIGESVANIFLGLGFDDRLDESILTETGYKSGFRFDFILYGSMPIILGYYTVIKRNIYDDKYLMLLHSYILTNAIWIMVIRASFSDRFAYLSWFLYPILLAYPLLKFDLWGERQGKWTAYILSGNIAFTYLMWLIR